MVVKFKLGHIDRKDFIFIVAVLALIFGGALLYKWSALFEVLRGYDRQVVVVNDPSDRSNQRYELTQNPSLPVQNQFQQNFEATLNDMLGDVFQQMNDYKVRRKILNDAIRPENLQNATYIEESYQVAGRIVSDLRQRSDAIIRVFGEKDGEIKRLIQNRTPEAQRNIWADWTRMKAEQVSLYVEYFAIEQRILDQYEGLVRHYYAHRDGVVYDSKANSVGFSDPALQQKAQSYVAAINALKREQAAL